MKREEWQKAYVPDEAALDRCVQTALSGLKEEKKTVRPRMMLAAALVLMMLAAAAVAAGFMYSEKYDVKLLAQQELERKYGLTREMDGLFVYDVQTQGETSVVTLHPMEMDKKAEERLGVYTVIVQNGKAQASWSHDGAENDGSFDSPAWGAAQLNEALEQKKAGKDWMEITGFNAAETSISEEQAIERARAAVAEKYGADALEAYTQVVSYPSYHEDEEKGYSREAYDIRFIHQEAWPEQWYAVGLYKDDGSVYGCKWRIDAPEGIQTGEPAEDHAQADALLQEKYGLTDKAISLFIVWQEDKDTVIYVPNLKENSILIDEEPGLAWLSDRVGRYTVHLDTGAVEWTLDGMNQAAFEKDSWGQDEAYGAEWLEQLDVLLEKRAEIWAQLEEDEWKTPEMYAQLDQLMRDAGFSARQYNHVLPNEGEWTQEQAVQAALEVVRTEYGLTEADISFENAECRMEDGTKVWIVFIHSGDAIYIVEMDAADGTIEDITYDSGLGGVG